MRILLRSALLVLVLAFVTAGVQTGALAQQNGNQGAQKPGSEDSSSKLSLGVGVICNTPEQIKRYLVLYQGPTTAEEAASTVNTETNSPGGCGMASIAFISGDYLGNVTVSGGIMRMFKIMVVAMKTEKGWERIPPTLQYTALFVKLDEA